MKVKETQWRVVAGILLVVAGALMLLQTFRVFRFAWEIVWALLFAGGGAYFLLMFVGRPSQWWAVIPAMALLGIGGLIALSVVGLDDAFGGSIFLVALSAAFWLVYLRSRENWWAVIPGGVLLTLAVVAGIDQLVPRAETSGIFFLGLGLTFAAIYLLPSPGERMKWALIPAGVLFAIGVIVTLATSSALRYLWPAALIAVGLYVVYRTVRAQ